MKTTELILLGAVGVLGYMLWKQKNKKLGRQAGQNSWKTKGKCCSKFLNNEWEMLVKNPKTQGGNDVQN